MTKVILLVALVASLVGFGTYVRVVGVPQRLMEVLPTGSAISCSKLGTLGVSRVVEVDGAKKYGSQIKGGRDFLDDKEVVLTFDDGPTQANTHAVLKALDDQCVRAMFFEIGQMITRNPQVAREVFADGMTIGTHTWSHKNLSKHPYDDSIVEIEKGISALHLADVSVAPFFRFPELQDTDELLGYLAKRRITVFSTDIDSRDFTMHKPERVVDSVMSQLSKRGRGIILLHDLHRNTADALPELLRQLKANGYKIVHVTSKQQEVASIAKYDQMVFRRH